MTRNGDDSTERDMMEREQKGNRNSKQWYRLKSNGPVWVRRYDGPNEEGGESGKREKEG